MTSTKTRAPGLTIVGWKPMRKNSLRGFADVRLPNGLTIHDVVVHRSNDRSWASLPGKPLVDADGVAKRDPATGKLRYVPILEWPDRATADRFSAAVTAAIEELRPGGVLR